MEIKLFTIGFTQKSAHKFFTTLKEARVQRVIDVRLNNNSQLAGFSKKEDLSYFLKELRVRFLAGLCDLWVQETGCDLDDIVATAFDADRVP